MKILRKNLIFTPKNHFTLVALSVWVFFFPGVYFLGKNSPTLERFSVSFYSLVFGTDLCQYEAFVNATTRAKTYKINWPNCVDRHDGWTPLHYAAHQDNIELAEELIRRNVKIEYTKHGDSPLNFVKSKDMAKLLIRGKGAKKALNHGNRFGFTPLFFPSGHEAVKIVDLFIKMGADASIRSRNGTSVWGVHAISGNLEVVEYFYKKGYDMYNVVENRSVHVCDYWPALSKSKNGKEFCENSKKMSKPVLP